jgi:phospholipid/cholesterol/gamma-HCH transport system substrate-binding protein
MNNAQQTARVGLFFLLGIALTWVTYETLSGGKILKDKGYQLIAGFESLRQLKEGDEVRMAGVKIGEVAKTRLSGSGRRAEAILRIDSHVKVKSDSTATIVMSGLIGTNYIGIDLGTANAPDLPPGAEIKTKDTPDLSAVMSQIGELGKKLEGALGNLGTALSGDGKGGPGIIQKVDQLVTENRENIQKTTANLADITQKVNQGEGTLGKLINNSKLHDELIATLDDVKKGAAEAKTFIANAQSIIDQVKKGQGAIGALVFDQKAGDDIKASIANLRAMSDKLQKGESTLGKLLNDDSIYRDAQAIMKKADRALEGLDDTGPITAVGVVARGLF